MAQLPSFVMRGLDPRIHAEVKRGKPSDAADEAAWIAGSSPAMTKSELGQWPSGSIVHWRMSAEAY
jgi:hypothetical protein